MSSKEFGKKLTACVAVLGALSGSGCMTYYVDDSLQNTSAAQIHKPSRPQEVQLLFNFRTKGAPNIRATEILTVEVTEVVSSSGLFAAVRPDPVSSGAVLNVTINSARVSDKKASRAEGLNVMTFGLAGATARIEFVCTVDYLPASGLSNVTRISSHTIYSTMGIEGAPPNTVKPKGIRDALRTTTRQVVTEALKELSQDEVFHSQG